MKLSKTLFVLCIIGWLLGLSGFFGEITTGFCLAMGSVMFILAFITRIIAKAEATKS